MEEVLVALVGLVVVGLLIPEVFLVLVFVIWLGWYCVVGLGDWIIRVILAFRGKSS